MSDALTDIYRDKVREDKIKRILELMLDCFEKPEMKEEGLKKLSEYVKRGMPLFLWVNGKDDDESISPFESLRKKIEKLEKSNKREWALFLSALLGKHSHFTEKFKKFSPFKDCDIVYVDYGLGFVNMMGVEKVIMDIVRKKRKGWQTYRADNYFVTLPEIDIDKVDVYWISGGKPGVIGPRHLKEREKQDESC